MDRRQLIAFIAGSSGVDEEKVARVLDGLERVTTSAVRSGEKVFIPGFLSIEPHLRMARTGRNPQMGETIQIPAARSVRLKAGSKLRRAAKRAPTATSLRQERRSAEDLPKRFVSTGFASRKRPSVDLSKDYALKVDEPYLFWLHVGDLQEHSIEDGTELPDFVPPEARIDVVVFATGKGVAVESPTEAAIQLRGLDEPEVVTQSATGVGRQGSRAYFEVRPTRTGPASFRCNLYTGQILLQSRLIEVVVGATRHRRRRALRARLDYAATSAFNGAWFERRRPHRLSVMVNGEDGTNQFIFSGDDGRTHRASVFTADTKKLGKLVDKLRSGLREASYGSAKPWQPGFDFRYRKSGNRKNLTADLINLAVRGRRAYLALTKELAPGGDGRDLRQARLAFERITRKPGLVEFVAKQSATLHVPAALLYDQPVTDADGGHELCEEFVRSLDAKEPLVDGRCFNGDCPTYENKMTVCPSGFWGYRHAIGSPVSDQPRSSDDGNGAHESAAVIVCDRAAKLVAGWETSLTGFSAHYEKVVQLAAFDDVGAFDSRDELFEAFDASEPHVIYLYCHGVHDARQDEPYLKVGNGERITPTEVQQTFYWPSSRPLVVINGCATTALEPGDSRDFASAFTGEPRASGVIGTETTIVEELAGAFAEYFLDEFVPASGEGKVGTGFGESIRRARLRLLADENPLGLVYAPFAAADLRVEMSGSVN